MVEIRHPFWHILNKSLACCTLYIALNVEVLLQLLQLPFVSVVQPAVQSYKRSFEEI